MPDYTDPVRMVRAIREHVRSTGHRVEEADNPTRLRLGYACPTCDILWTVGLVSLRGFDSTRLPGMSLIGVTRDRSVRERLTGYLNWEFDEPRPSSLVKPVVVPVLSRYKRPWVV